MIRRNNYNETVQFSTVEKEPESEAKKVINAVCAAMEDKGYNPVNQIVGYILSGDPTYITSHNNARSLIRRIDRFELLQILLKEYINNSENQ